MNANETFPTNNARLNRIRTVSRCLRTVFFTFTVLLIIAALMCLVALGNSIIQQYVGGEWESGLATATNVVYALCAWFCFRLFNLYSHGGLFSGQIVQTIRRIACLYFMAMVLQFLNKLYLHSVPNESPAGWEWTVWFGLIFYLFPSFLILFIAWVMDEGRKIQEEQALTV